MALTSNRSLKINKETSKIVLNVLELTLDEVSLHSDASKEVQQPSTTEIDSKDQRVIFAFAKALPARSEARLTISFKADITGHMAGYYKSLGGADGKTVCALTQFQVRSIHILSFVDPYSPGLAHGRETGFSLLGRTWTEGHVRDHHDLSEGYSEHQ